jgi:hypothetical protein
MSFDELFGCCVNVCPYMERVRLDSMSGEMKRFSARRITTQTTLIELVFMNHLYFLGIEKGSLLSRNLCLEHIMRKFLSES